MAIFDFFFRRLLNNSAVQISEAVDRRVDKMKKWCEEGNFLLFLWSDGADKKTEGKSKDSTTFQLFMLSEIMYVNSKKNIFLYQQIIP